MQQRLQIFSNTLSYILRVLQYLNFVICLQKFYLEQLEIVEGEGFLREASFSLPQCNEFQFPALSLGVLGSINIIFLCLSFISNIKFSLYFRTNMLDTFSQYFDSLFSLEIVSFDQHILIKLFESAL